MLLTRRPQRVRSSLRYPCMLSRRLPTLTTSPPVAWAAACPWSHDPGTSQSTRRACLADGAEVPTVDLIDRGSCLVALAGRTSCGPNPPVTKSLEPCRVGLGLGDRAGPAGHTVTGPRSPAGGPIRSSPALPIGAAWPVGLPCAPLERDREGEMTRPGQDPRRPPEGLAPVGGSGQAGRPQTSSRDIHAWRQFMDGGRCSPGRAGPDRTVSVPGGPRPSPSFRAKVTSAGVSAGWGLFCGLAVL